MRDNAIGILGTLSAFGLERVHLIAATVCALLTATHLGVSLYQKLKARREKKDK